MLASAVVSGNHALVAAAVPEQVNVLVVAVLVPPPITYPSAQVVVTVSVVWPVSEPPELTDDALKVTVEQVMAGKERGKKSEATNANP